LTTAGGEPGTVTVVETECEYSLRGVQGKTEFARSARAVNPCVLQTQTL